MSNQFFAGICLYRTKQCGEKQPHQYADRTQGIGHDIVNPRKDHAHQPFPHQQGLASGDLPGYGYAKRGKSAMEALKRLIESYVVCREQLTCLFVLIDSRLKPQKIDLSFINFLGEHGIPFAIVFTKVDKLRAGERKKNIQTFLQTLQEQWEELPPHFVTSSEKGEGRSELLDYMDSITKEVSQQEQAGD